MPKVFVYHEKPDGAGLGLPHNRAAIRHADQLIETGNFLPFQRRVKLGRKVPGTEYILVPVSPRVHRMLDAIKRLPK